MTLRPAVVDGAIVGAGAVLLVAGFLPWWQVGIVDLETGRTAWDVSAAWWLPTLAGTVTGGLWLLRRLGRLPLPWLPGITALVGLIGLGLVAGRWLSLPSSSGDFGWYAYSPPNKLAAAFRSTPGPGLWLALAALAAQLVAATVALRRPAAAQDQAQP